MKNALDPVSCAGILAAMKKLFFISSSLFIAIIFISVIGGGKPALAAPSISAWWPTEGAHMQGTQPFKALLEGQNVSSYDLYWQVDNGSLNAMRDSSIDYPHKETSVDLDNWDWHGTGPYAVTFVAKQDNATVARKTVHIYVDSPAPTASQTSSAPAETAAPVASAPVQPSTAFYVDPHSSAANQASAWQSSRPNDAEKMKVLAKEPTAKWLGGWSADIKSAAADYVAAAGGKTAVLVAYNIPQRDCGGYSAGGARDYISWISSLAAGIGSGNAIVILEPDSLAQMSCLSGSDQAARLSLLSQAVTILKKEPHVKVYLDAGHAGWIDAGTMAGRLAKANIKNADGFSLNVSNYDASSLEAAYGKSVSAKLGGKHFVIDTSRNGNGSNGQWCNATGRAIGASPTTATGDALVDAFLWIKTPGESDGTCNGGPSAGKWWPEYALSLVNNAQ